jgi:4-hydroxy-tetrahydrodipicolinate synthase
MGERLPVWAGVGAASSAKALALGRELVAAGADALLAVTPYYARPTQEGLYRHFSLLADELSAPIVLYNVPSRTGVDLLPATVERLLDHPKVVGIKEAVSSAARLQSLLALRRADFAILSGDDGTCAEWMMQGADGVVSVVANVVPVQVAELAALATDDPAACTLLQHRLGGLIEALNVAPNPIPIKCLLSMLGRCGPVLRLPLTELEPRHAAPLRNAYETAIAS